LFECLEKDLVWRTSGERFQGRDRLRSKSPVSRRIGVDDVAAAQRLAWRCAPHDESIVLEERKRGAEPKLDPGRFPGIQSLAVEEGDAGG
jgi:hypothetical protein